MLFVYFYMFTLFFGIVQQVCSKLVEVTGVAESGVHVCHLFIFFFGRGQQVCKLVEVTRVSEAGVCKHPGVCTVPKTARCNLVMETDFLFLFLCFLEKLEGIQ